MTISAVCAFASVLDRPGQRGIDSSQARQSLGVQAVVFSGTFRDEFHLPWIGHDDLMSQTPQ
jgi:hypothetical protein